LLVISFIICNYVQNVPVQFNPSPENPVIQVQL